MASDYKQARESLQSLLYDGAPMPEWNTAQWDEWEQRLARLRTATLRDALDLLDEQLERDERELLPTPSIRFGMRLVLQRLADLVEAM